MAERLPCLLAARGCGVRYNMFCHALDQIKLDDTSDIPPRYVRNDVGEVVGPPAAPGASHCVMQPMHIQDYRMV